jgi:hypothetical protein
MAAHASICFVLGCVACRRSLSTEIKSDPYFVYCNLKANRRHYRSRLWRCMVCGPSGCDQTIHQIQSSRRPSIRPIAFTARCRTDPTRRIAVSNMGRNPMAIQKKAMVPINQSI